MGTKPCLVYRRGSVAGSMFSFSPKAYPAAALVEIVPGAGSPTTVFATLEVNTTGQIVTKGMRRSWEQELDGLVTDYAGGPDAVHSREILAATPAVHAEMLAYLRSRHVARSQVEG